MLTCLKVAGLAVVAAIAAALPAKAQSEDWGKVVEAAKKEGKVVIYHMSLGAPYFKAVVADFEKKFGIKVESLDLRASELVERLRTEQSSGRFLGDVAMISSTMIEEQVQKGDAIQKLPALPNLANLRPPFKPTEVSVPAYVQAIAILVNTDLVKAGEEPKSWKDILDARYKGKILSDDMRPLGSGNTMFSVLHKSFGMDFSEKLAAQQPVFSRDLRNDARRVARGEYPIYMPQIPAFASDLKGLPVKVVIPDEGMPFATMELAMLKNAPSPNAARVLMNYFLETDSQIAYAKAWQLPVAKGVADKLDPEAARFANGKLLGNVKLSERAGMQALAKKLFDK